MVSGSFVMQLTTLLCIHLLEGICLMQGLSLKGAIVFAPFVRRSLVAFRAHDSGNIRPASVRLT
jgi:hypothetical protein